MQEMILNIYLKFNKICDNLWDKIRKIKFMWI